MIAEGEACGPKVPLKFEDCYEALAKDCTARVRPCTVITHHYIGSLKDWYLFWMKTHQLYPRSRN